MIRILVVEDSKTVQQLLVSAFNADPALEVIGTAETGEDAVEAARTLKPDLITMDINLDGMNGLDATRAIMSTAPVPIVIVSGKVDPEDSSALFRFIEAGALMVLAKPEPVGSPGHASSMARLIHYLKLMSEIKVVRRLFPRLPARLQESRVTLPDSCPRIKVVAIGASTGGPPLLQQILSSLPSRFGTAILVVQHMVEGFTDHFVHWLNQTSRLPVLVAKDGMMILPGTVYVAPHGREMEVAADSISLVDAPPRPGVRPSVSALFRSVALSYGRNSVGVLLSGMGSDGAHELKRMRDCGAVTIAQNRESCVVFGMPGEAIRLNAADYVLSPEEIIDFLRKAVPPLAAE